MSNEDLIRLRHMLESAQEARAYAVGKTRLDLDRDRMLVHSLVRCIEIVGEAASKVSPQGQTEIPAIPWPDIVSMRNRLVHAYFDINLDLVWDTVVDDLPPLVAALQKVPGV
jgi:uncharacterized protein with HEPN domain